MYERYLKRVVDIILACAALALVSWLLVGIIVIYLIFFNKPIFFVQERIGRREKFFFVWKFRTLKNNNAPLEDRRFWWGDFLRVTSMDELPQLWNVIRGEMSLVGPRPLPTTYLPLFTQDQRQRHQVRPGITGLAQVNGRTALPWKEKFKFDIYYVQNVSFLMDLKIMIQTVALLAKFKRDVSLTEKPFTGQ